MAVPTEGQKSARLTRQATGRKRNTRDPNNTKFNKVNVPGKNHISGINNVTKKQNGSQT